MNSNTLPSTRLCGLTAEYPATPKVILKSVATWLRSHVQGKGGYVATQKP